MKFFIFFRRKTVLFAEGTEKAGVIFEAVLQVYFTYAGVGEDRIFASGKTFFYNILMNWNTHLLFEQMSNIIFTNKKSFS